MGWWVFFIYFFFSLDHGFASKTPKYILSVYKITQKYLNFSAIRLSYEQVLY